MSRDNVRILMRWAISCILIAESLSEPAVRWMLAMGAGFSLVTSAGVMCLLVKYIKSH